MYYTGISGEVSWELLSNRGSGRKIPQIFFRKFFRN
jgi:hypothetical protein